MSYLTLYYSQVVIRDRKDRSWRAREADVPEKDSTKGRFYTYFRNPSLLILTFLYNLTSPLYLFTTKS